MPKLTITAKGQVTLRKEALKHLGVAPGDKIELELLADGEGRLRAARPTHSIDRFIGMFAGRSKRVASIDELNQAAAAGWTGKR